MSDIIPGFVVMAVYALIVAILYLPLLPHAWRNRQHGPKAQRLDLLFAIIMFSTATACILSWFAAAVVLREMKIPYPRATDHVATLALIVMAIAGAGFFIRGVTRDILSGQACWTLVVSGALTLWTLLYLTLP